MVAEITRPADSGEDDDVDTEVVYDEDDDDYTPILEIVEDRGFGGVSGEALGQAFQDAGLTAGYALLVDARSVAEVRKGGEITVVYVDLMGSDPEDVGEEWFSSQGNTFRTLVTEVASIEANLSIANLDFADFAGAVDDDGVYRGAEED